jgi:hypothetical protein
MVVSCQLHAPAVLLRGKRLWYAFDRPQSRSGRCGKEKISCPSWESKPYRPARNLPIYLLFTRETDVGIGQENFPSLLKVSVVYLTLSLLHQYQLLYFQFLPHACIAP